jgi:pyruvate-formate lyase-activating enzyme
MRWRGQLVRDLAAFVRPVARDLLRPPPHAEGATPTLRRLVNLWRLRWEWYHVAPVLKSRPARLCIEATSACNLRCPHCFTGRGETSRPRATLSLAFYRQLLAELGDCLWQIEFHNWGEPLLNRNLCTMIAEASARGLSTSLCTNLSVPFDAGRAEALVGAGLKLLGLSIDGARQATYEQYRVGGELDLVLHNCRLLTAAKRRLGSRTPRITWSFHAFAHNVDDVEVARAMAEELGIEFHVSRGRVFGPDWDPEARAVPHEPVAPMPCYTLFHTAVVYADGSVAPCRGSFYREDDMGRLAVDGHPGAQTFIEVWNGERLRLARGFFRRRGNGSADGQGHICADCPAQLDWHGFLGHIMLGGEPGAWTPRYTSNERYNYFWSRRPRIPGDGTSPTRHDGIADASPDLK